MSTKGVRSSTREAGTDRQDDWLDLLAPDRRPRLRLYGDTTAARQPHLPCQLRRELTRLLAVP